jgi:chromatin segregation and condensation protein Rec8/ScpA/Scc1 (kleisin family)
LAKRIETTMKMNFKDLSGVGKAVTREERVVVIVGFLAMLEMVRQGMIDAIQEIDGGDIIIEKQVEVL